MRRLFSLLRVFSARGFGTVNILPEGGGREETPLFKGCNQSSFWLLNCELWPYIIFLFIFEYTCGWKSAFLVNKLFIYYSPQSSIYYQNVLFLC